MKKFILAACLAVTLLFAGYYAYYHLGIFVSVSPERPVTTFMKADEDTIYMDHEGEYIPFEIRGVDLGEGSLESGPPILPSTGRPICAGLA